MNVFKYFNAVYSYIIMYSSNDINKESVLDNYKKCNQSIEDIELGVYNYFDNNKMNTEDSYLSFLRQKYDIESDGGLIKKYLLLEMMLNNERIAIGM